VRDSLSRLLGRVAEWQTRWLQVPVSFGTWGFKSPFAHNERFLGTVCTKATNAKRSWPLWLVELVCAVRLSDEGRDFRRQIPYSVAAR
jgi:hypothetical protein